MWQRKYPECFYDAAKYFNVMLMLNGSEEETAGINSCFENHFSIIRLVQFVLLHPVFLSVVNAKVRVAPILMERLKVFNISEFPLT